MIKRVISYLNEKVLANHLFQSLVSFFSFKLLETNQANQYLANVMLWFAVCAFSLWILEKTLGVKTPLINVGRFFKVFRHSGKFDDPDKFIDGLNVTYEESKIIIEKGRKPMKRILNLIYANKKTISGGILAALMAVELIFNLSARWGWDREWYITAVFFLFALIEVAIFGKGPETVAAFFNRKKLEDKIKKSKEYEKEKARVNKFRRLAGLPPLEDAPETKEKAPVQEDEEPQPLSRDDNPHIRQRL